MATASIGDLTLDINPSEVNWAYQVRHNVTDTVGGKVVQVFGVQVGDMSVSGSFGSGGTDSQKTFLAKVTDMMERQADTPSQKTRAPYRFIFPERGWDFSVQIKSYDTPDGTGSVYADVNVLNPKWQLTLFIEEDNANLKQIATDAFIQRLSQGIGWDVNEFNGPVGGAPGTSGRQTVTPPPLARDSQGQVNGFVGRG